MQFMLRIAALAVGLLAILPASALAVDYGGVGGRPANPVAGNARTQSIFVYDLDLGGVKNDGVRVFNNTAEQRTVAIEAVDSVASSDGGFACAQAVDPKQDVGSWVTVSAKTVVLKPRSSSVVPFQLKVPESADAGEHDGCITIQDVSSNAQTQRSGGVVLGFRSALRMVVTIPGELSRRLEFAGLDVARSSEGRTVIIRPRLKNVGNVSADTKLSVVASTVFNRKTYTNGGTYPVLPRTTGSWNYEFKPSIFGGWYSISAQASYASDATQDVGKDGAQTIVKSGVRTIFIAPDATGSTIIFGGIGLVAVFAWLWHNRRRRIKLLRIGAIDHVVKKSDTIQSVSEKHGVSWKAVAQINSIKAPYVLDAGATLKIPKLAATPDSPKKPKDRRG